jgi:hypothetical protein
MILVCCHGYQIKGLQFVWILRQLNKLNYMLAIHKGKHHIENFKEGENSTWICYLRYIYECPSWDEMCWIHLEMKTKVVLMYNLHYMTHIVFELMCHTNSLQCQFQNMTKRKSVLRIFLFQKWCWMFIFALQKNKI